MKRLALVIICTILITNPVWAATPTVTATNTSSETINVTSHTVDIPTGSGGLVIILFCAANPDVDPLTWPGDFIAFASDITSGVAFYAAYGTSNNATETVITTGSRTSTHVTYRISGAENTATQAPEAALVRTFGIVLDPPSLTPTGGAKDYLWLAGSCVDDNGVTITGAPTSYTSLLTEPLGTLHHGSARRALNASSENPGTFTVTGSTNQNHVDSTIAIHPLSVSLPPLGTLMGVGK